MKRDPLVDCTGFEWDAGNLDKNWAKHGVTFWKCEEVFLNRAHKDERTRLPPFLLWRSRRAPVRSRAPLRQQFAFFSSTRRLRARLASESFGAIGALSP